jgi:hypothetical protein
MKTARLSVVLLGGLGVGIQSSNVASAKASSNSAKPSYHTYKPRDDLYTPIPPGYKLKVTAAYMARLYGTMLVGKQAVGSTGSRAQAGTGMRSCAGCG